MTRKFALVLLAKIFAALLLAGAAPALAAGNKAAPTPAPVAAGPAAAAPIAPASNGAGDSAQAGPTDPPAARLDAAKQSLDQLDAYLTNDSLSDADLVHQRAAMEPISTLINGVIAEVTPKLAAAKTRLDQLGQPPDPKADPPPAPEDPAVAQDRKDQLKLVAAYDDLIKRANLAQVRTEQITTQIAERRRAIFTNEVFQRTSSILSPSLWIDVGSEIPRYFRAAGEDASQFSRKISGAMGEPAALLLIASFLLLFSSLAASVFVTKRVIPREKSRRDPTELQKTAAALWTGMAVASIPIAGAGAFFALAEWFGLSVAQLKPLHGASFTGIVRCALAAGMGTAILAPNRPIWRPVDLTDRVAQRLMTLVLSLAIVISLGKIVEAANEVVGASLQVSVAVRGGFALLVGLLLTRGLYGIVGGPKEEDGETAAVERSAKRADESPWWPPIRFVTWTAIVSIIAADVFGYVALSAFIVEQIVWVGFVAGLLFLLTKLVSEGAEQAFRPKSRFSRSLIASLGVRRERLQQVGVLLSAIAQVALYAIAALLVLAPWGLQSHDLVGAIKSAFFGVKIGDVTISLSSLILALVYFAIGYALTHAAQNWLENRYLPLTELDTGLRASIRTSVGYIGILVSLGFAVAFLGLNLEKLALIAGALSVGIGLGLQSVVNNFVSGLILLWERAIRVGDLIVVGDEQGYVRRINVRATEIETFDRSMVIVPNGNMVTGIVKNLVRGDRVGRIIIPVKVVWGSDPEKVRQVLIEAAKSHDEVVRFPAPSVFFSAFGQTSLDFDLVCFVEDVERARRVKSDLHFAIFTLFAEAGLAMTPPSPSTTLTLDMSQVETLAQRFAAKPGDMKT